jgi:hypothetical protein
MAILFYRSQHAEKGENPMRMIIFSLAVAAILTSVAPASALPPKGYCAKQPTIDACVACSETSPYRRPIDTPSGMKLWCEANMPRRCRAAGKQFVRSAADAGCMHKVFGNEPLQTVERDTGRTAALVPGEDAAPRREPVNNR